ncbi:outer membrane protein [Sphingomonas trueperi]|uniref:outer membrane protein n=1 Tax=Sphingomonas trueperi TaxID=53317 RepID=UPI003397BD6C
MSLAALAFAGTAAPAFAQDSPRFTGPRVSADAGWGRVAGNGLAGDGFDYGATLGYDVAAGNLRIGPEVGIADSTQDACKRYPAGGASARECGRSDRDLYAGVRLGYTAAPKLLVYGKVGYTNARFSDRYEDVSTGSKPAARFADDHSGYRLGAGAEWAVTRQVFVNGEYRFSQYGDHLHQNQILGGVGLRF